MDIDYSGEKFAFPSDFTVEPAKGLTKREYIAAQVFAHMCSNVERMQTLFNRGDNAHEIFASSAVRAADALIEELDQ